MDGFFSGAPLRPIVDVKDENVDKFAQAIAGRFNNAERPLLTARLTPADVDQATPIQLRFRAASSSDGKQQPATVQSVPNSPMNRMTLAPRSAAASSSNPPPSTSAYPPSSFTTTKASDLPQFLQNSNEVVVLDIRAHSAYSTYRLPRAISLSVPSTLLKRPAFTLHKLANMLSSAAARKRFNTWDTASRILVYDADSTVLNEGSNLLGLLRKFRLEGFKGDVAWLHGGIQSVWKDRRDLIDSDPLVEEEPENDGSGFLRARDLPVSAFTNSSTMTRSSGIPTPEANALTLPTASSAKIAAIPMRMSRPGGKITDLSPVSYITAANPFYDNIRQNRELSHGMTERIPLLLSDRAVTRLKDLPFDWLREIASHAGKGDSTEALAMQFYRIELGEQRRLQGVMDHHSRAGKVVLDQESVDEKQKIIQSSKKFPYSILAGFEKGNKNRYRNIWPFEHARVKLKAKASDDYINASYVQPLSTRRRYIATQGPLPSTFKDFWMIVWEQDVRVIVMLTKQFEGGDIKCGQYWEEGEYGPLRLKCISAGGALEEDRGGTGQTSAFGPGGGGFFTAPTDGSCSDGGGHNNTIRRVFELSHTGLPTEPPRVVRQLQYVGWPDMDVPSNPKGFLKFMWEVDALVDSVNSISKHDTETPHYSPALLHCSAGVGRTGSFIIIDAILDGIRREIRKKAEMIKANTTSSDTSKGDSGPSSPEVMEVDSSRDASMEPVVPASTIADSTSVFSQKSSTPTSSSLSPEPQLHAGPTATLHVGGTKRRGGGNDIHIPMVSASQEATTPRAQGHMELPMFVPPSSTPSSAPKFVRSPSDMGAHGHSSHAMSPRRASGAARHRLHHRPSQQPRRLVTSDFTEADADSMFTSESSNPAFAMDVESVHPIPRWAVGAGGNSSSGEGTGSASGNDLGSVSSGSVGRSGASARNAFVAPISQALARLSSGDDVKSLVERPDSVGRKMVRLAPRGRAGSGSGSGSGSGEGASISSSAGGSGSGSGSGRGSGGSFASSSSLGLSTFAGMGLSSANSPSPMAIAATGGRPAEGRVLEDQQSQGLNASTDHSKLHEPKPMHPLQQPEVIEVSLMKKRMTEHSRLKHHRNSTHSHSQSSSSVPSTDFISSTSSPQGASSDTPLSTHGISRASSPDSNDKTGSISKSGTSETVQNSEKPGHSAQWVGYDFVDPRRLHSEDSPPLLSTLEEPIREVLEDMREQRMSLCQSLRQYVFVHSAIIEGSLRIIDEERRRAGIAEGDDLEFNINPKNVLPELASSVASGGKRGPSPTELSKEDKKGDVALAKRPSFRRAKSTSSGDSTGSV